MAISVAEALGNLLDASQDGRLSTLAGRFGLEIVTLFGSALDSSDPGDIDVAVGFVHGGPRDFLAVVNALAELVPGDHVDVMDLNRAGPVAQKAAMVGARVLFSAHPSVVTEREIKAFMEYEDTRWLRDLQTEALRR